MATKSTTLREMRLDKRLTQQDVATAMKVSQAHYSAIERGEKPRDVDEAMKTVNRMRSRSDRTGGGDLKAGRKRAE